MSDNEPVEQLLTQKEVAALLCLHPTTLKVWIHKGKGPKYSRIGGAIRYRPEDIQAFINEGLIDPTETKTKEV